MKIKEDFPLLDLMMKHQRVQSSKYHPGPHWGLRTKVVIRQIKRYGLSNFRGEENVIGVSLSDADNVDVRHTLDRWPFLPLKCLLRIFPIGRLFDSQVATTKAYAALARQLRVAKMQGDPRTKELLYRYKMPPSLLGGALEVVGDVSAHYLATLDQLDHMAQHIDFTKMRSFFEIGGGFGANVHILLENYPNIRKIIYLDIPPTLYIGTQYLKTFYGDSVRDFRQTLDETKIRFQNDDTLEILAIAPWQIENLDVSIDMFFNASSFVEMPRFVVQNYASKVMDKSPQAVIGLISYDNNTDITIPPEDLPSFFPKRTFKYSHFQMYQGWCGAHMYTSVSK